jgi:hypothetical protein
MAPPPVLGNGRGRGALSERVFINPGCTFLDPPAIRLGEAAQRGLWKGANPADAVPRRRGRLGQRQPRLPPPHALS